MSVSMIPFRCTCSHLNLQHRTRKGMGAFRCDRCDCTHFTWDGELPPEGAAPRLADA